MDCMEYMKSVPDKFFELAVVDPPYGLDKKSTHGRGKLKNRCLNRGNIQKWDIRPSKGYFDKPAKHVTIPNRGGQADRNKFHPTQKPIELYAYLLHTFANPGDKVLDTHLGSGSSRIAAYKMGFDFYGTEIDKEYFDAQEKRFQEECLGEIRLRNGNVYVQKELFEL